VSDGTTFALFLVARHYPGGRQMRIAVIGMGNVGSVLGRRWAQAGHQVEFCVRDPDNPDKRAHAEKVKAAIGPVGDAAHADVVLLAVPWGAVPDALKAAGDLGGKVP
jgi:predicted dinucleotide-binding enzyme